MKSRKITKGLVSMMFFLFMLLSLNAQTGVSCREPQDVSAVQPLTNINGYLWYKYIVTGNANEDREILIKVANSTVELYSDCGQPLYNFTQKIDNENYFYAIHAKAGDTLLINADNTSTTFQILYDISALQSRKGYLPNEPMQLFLGKNTLSTGTYDEGWGEYTFEEDGSLVIETNSQYAVLYRSAPTYLTHNWQDFNNFMQPQVLTFSSSHYSMYSSDFKTTLRINGKAKEKVLLRLFNDHVAPSSYSAKLIFRKLPVPSGMASNTPINLPLNSNVSVPLVNNYEYLYYSYVQLYFPQAGKYKVSANKNVSLGDAQNGKVYEILDTAVLNITQSGNATFALVLSNYGEYGTFDSVAVMLKVVQVPNTETPTDRVSNMVTLSNDSIFSINPSSYKKFAIFKAIAPFNGQPVLDLPETFLDLYRDPNLLTPASLPVKAGDAVYFAFTGNLAEITNNVTIKWVRTLDFLDFSAYSSDYQFKFQVNKSFVNKKIEIYSNYYNNSANIDFALPARTVMVDGNNQKLSNSYLTINDSAIVKLIDIFGDTARWTIDVIPSTLPSSEANLLDVDFSPEKQLSKMYQPLSQTWVFDLMWQRDPTYCFTPVLSEFATISSNCITVPDPMSSTNATFTVTVYAEDGTPNVYNLSVVINAPSQGKSIDEPIYVYAGNNAVNFKNTPLDLYYAYVNNSEGKQVVTFKSMNYASLTMQRGKNGALNYKSLGPGQSINMLLNKGDTLFYYFGYVSRESYTNYEYNILTTNIIPGDKELIGFMAGEWYVTYPVKIDRLNRKIIIDVPTGTTAISSYTAIVSANATYSTTNYSISNGDTLIIMAMDSSKSEWTFQFNEKPIEPGKIIYYSVPGELAPAWIDSTNRIVWVFYDLTKKNDFIIPSFKLTEGAQLYHQEELQTSGISPVDVSRQTSILYSLSDPQQTSGWTIEFKDVNALAPELLTFDLHGQVGRPVIDRNNNIITVQVGGYVSLKNIKTYYTVTPDTTVTIENEPVTSGYPVDYSGGGTKTLKLTSGVATKTYTLAISQVAKPCAAAFAYTVKADTVYFSNQTQNAETFLWDFGDGNISMEKEPVHVYSSAGNYAITLTAVDPMTNCIDNVTKVVTIGAVICKSEFSYTVNHAMRTVTFNNASNGVYYLWNFGDGSVSTDQNPVHTYTKDGSYKVSLITGTIAANCKDISEQVVVIGDNNCNASFTYYIDEASKRVTFQGVEDPNYMHTWEFPDGTVITDAMPVVPFAKRLIGKVKHSILNVANNCSDFYEQTIQFGFNSDDCEADFFYVPQELSVAFTSTTAGNIVKYVWNFGDGTISTEANPVHTYNVDGIYNTCLTVVNNKGNTDITCKKVAAGNPVLCVANYNYVVNPNTREAFFVDQSLGDHNQWLWDFGDNNTATTPYALHGYANAGYYLTSLEISGNNCSSKSFKLINVGMPGRLKVMFAYFRDMSNQKAGGYPVDFIGAGLGDEVRIKWDFGDGTTDTTTTSPTHVYSSPGTYTVCYEVSDPITQASDLYCQQVVITDIPNRQAPLAEQIDAYPNPMYDKLFIHLVSPSNNYVYTVKLTDLTGRTIQTALFKAVKGENIFTWDVNTIKSGTYILHIKSLNKDQNLILIKK